MASRIDPLYACAHCRRHVKSRHLVCPFCGARSEAVRGAARRAAFGAGVVLSAATMGGCSAVYGVTVDYDGWLTGTTTTTSSTSTVPTTTSTSTSAGTGGEAGAGGAAAAGGSAGAGGAQGGAGGASGHGGEPAAAGGAGAPHDD